jgi:hypothetical protein
MSHLPSRALQSDIREIYEVLEETRERFLVLGREFDLRIPLRDVEQRWGEYFVASSILRARIGGVRVQRRGVDIVTDRGSVEVKTSRRTRRFRGGKVGYGWAVKREQWRGRQFDYLVCVLSDVDPPKALAFTRDEVVEKFTKASFTRDNTRVREHDSKRLDLIDGGLAGFEANLARSKKVTRWEGTPTKFERDFNANPGPVFNRYGLERMYCMMKRQAKAR